MIESNATTAGTDPAVFTIEAFNELLTKFFPKPRTTIVSTPDGKHYEIDLDKIALIGAGGMGTPIMLEAFAEPERTIKLYPWAMAVNPPSFNIMASMYDAEPMALQKPRPDRQRCAQKAMRCYENAKRRLRGDHQRRVDYWFKAARKWEKKALATLRTKKELDEPRKANQGSPQHE